MKHTDLFDVWHVEKFAESIDSWLLSRVNDQKYHDSSGYMTYRCSCVHDDLCGRYALGRSRYQKKWLQIEAEIGHDGERGVIDDADAGMTGVMSSRLIGACSCAFVDKVLSSYRLVFEGLGTAGGGSRDR